MHASKTFVKNNIQWNKDADLNTEEFMNLFLFLFAKHMFMFILIKTLKKCISQIL